MRVYLSEYAGFCPGVKRAIELATGAAGEERVFTWGPLVHNRQMEQYLARKGIEVAEEPPRTGVTVIRSHGVGRQQLARLERAGSRLVDATCPHVARIHKIVRDLPPDTDLIVIGQKDHPEIQGIVGWATGRVRVVNTPAEAMALEFRPPATIVVQTTFNRDLFRSITGILQERTPDITVHDTLCPATVARQAEAAGLAEKCQLMLVIGGKNSANTNKLVEICRQTGVCTHHIQSVQDVDPGWFEGIQSVGITAGASTPEWIIREVVQLVMETENEGIEEKEEPTEILVEETKPLAVGDIVVGTVVQVNPDEVLVDVGQKMEGLIRKEELSFRKVEQCSELVNTGDSLEAEVTRLTEDLLELSVRKVAQAKAWKEVREAFENQTPITGKVVEEVKGGLIVDLGLRGFMPASLVDLRFVEDLGQFVGQDVTVLVIELERRRNKVIVSRKAYLMQQAEEQKQQTLATLEEDSVIKGIVRRLTSFGAFVDVGGIDGLIHISELAHHRVEHPSEVLKEDEEIEVYVLKVDPEAERVSLSLKKILPDPWTMVDDKFNTNEIVEGKIVRLADFGAFVELIPGVDGLVHVSQIAEEHVEKPSDVLSVGQQVKVKILDIDSKAKRVSLSIREADRDQRRDSRGAEDESGIGATIGERLGNLFDEETEEDGNE